MIFSAGLGTRLYPYTKDTPKALVEINNKTFLEIAILKFIKIGVKDIIVNIHHFPDQIIHFLKDKQNFGINIAVSDESDQLLDTGGGIKKASWFFDDGNPFFIHNVDVLTDLDLDEMLRYHQDNNALATLAVRNRETSRYLLFDSSNVLCGWENIKTGEKILAKKSQDLRRLAFSGVHIIDPVIFDELNEDGRFSIINAYLRLASERRIVAFEDNKSAWVDIGTPEKLVEAKTNYLFLT